MFNLPEHRLSCDIRGIKTLDGGIPVYKNARVRIMVVDPNSLYPTSKYVLTGNLEKIRQIRQQFLNKDHVDIFKSKERLSSMINGNRIVISPPIIEIVNNEPLIIDGLHRCYEARRRGESLSVAIVSGSDYRYPPIGLPVSWKEVVERPEQPIKGEDCRRLRQGIIDDPAVLRIFYRDFSSLGSMGRRPRLGQYG